MPVTKTITLRKPITYGKGDSAKSVEEIELREPTAGDYESAERMSGTVDFAVSLVAVISGLPVDAVDKTGISVTAEAMAFFDSFAEGAGEPPSTDDDWTIELSAPLELKTEKGGDVAMSFSSLNLSEPTNQQRRKAGQAGGPYATAIALISLNASVLKGAVRKLPATEFLQICSYLNGFQARRQAIAPD